MSVNCKQNGNKSKNNIKLNLKSSCYLSSSSNVKLDRSSPVVFSKSDMFVYFARE